jgi:mannose-6-phosphate isomerase-like protein (cupin superfamily)
MDMDAINIEHKFSLFKEYWSPKILAELNGQVVKIAKIKGEFIWHKHDEEDEFFLVTRGSMVIKLRDRDIHLKQGEFAVIPRGIEHKPVAEEEAHILMFEPASTINTGDVQNELTQETNDWI